MASNSGSKAEFIIGGKYKLLPKIRSGSFGDIYLVINITNGEGVAVSLKSQARHPQLLDESKLYETYRILLHYMVVLTLVLAWSYADLVNTVTATGIHVFNGRINPANYILPYQMYTNSGFYDLSDTSSTLVRVLVGSKMISLSQ
ncbi:hypothetical protein STEG23_013475 [Scotinomys teguina]